MHDTLRVGIIGASPGRWAAAAHIPAIQALNEYELTAVATSRQESANAAAHAFNAALAFDDYRQLVEHPEIDIVVVAVKALHHRELIEAALRANKHVYSEWPLGNGLKETQELAALASKKNLHTAIGLQGRMAPAIRKVKTLIDEGYVGKVLSTNFFASAVHFDGTVDRANTHMLHKGKGSGMLVTHLGQFADPMLAVLGEFTSIQAVAKTLLPTVKINDSQETVTATNPDNLAVIGTLEGGVVASLHLFGGTSSGPAFTWNINGSEGEIIISSRNGFIHWGELDVFIAKKGQPLQKLALQEESPRIVSLRGTPAYNIAYMYRQFASDIHDNTYETPDFDVALKRHKMIDAVERLAE